MAVEVGSYAPDFTLRDSNGEEVSLSSFRGKKSVLLVFYPFAFSGICTGELCQVRDELPRYQNDDVQVLAVSTDPTFTLKAWAQAERYGFPLLSDFWPHGAVAQAYGVFNDKAGMAMRGTFLVDPAGVVRFSEVNEPGEARDQAGWHRAIAELVAA
ncbi:MAG TPA: peroxiredoxin [Mycobacteriales bacterium]|nr:peroxiredoxin [Mycobacteriales bacterium]